jgi:hypothetical protein
MIRIAEELAKGHSFVRVDLYQIQDRIFFGELTFYPAAGLSIFTPSSYDQYFGELLDLS